VQLDPTKLTLKASGTNLLTLKYDILLSNVAFNFNLRQYTEGGAHFAARLQGVEVRLGNPGRCMTKCVKPLRRLERLSAKSSRSPNQNAPFGQLSTACC